MSCRIIDSGNRLDRTANVVQGSSDFTVMFWYRPVTILATSYTQFVTVNGLGTYTKWAGLFGDFGHYKLDVDNGTSQQTADYFNQSITSDIWKHLCYSRSGTTNTFYLNGLPVQNGALTLDLSAASFTITLLGDDGTADGNTHEFSNYREWDVALTQAQINAELASTSAVVHTAGLVAFTPLTSDGTDHSGNGNNWTTVGSVSFVSDPVFPANFCPNAAKALGNGGSDSASMSAGSGVCSLFYSYIPFSFQAGFSAFAFGSLGVFTPFCNVVSPTLVQLNGSENNKAVYISVEESFVANPVVTEVIPEGTLTVPSVTFQANAFQNSTAPIASVAIPTTSEMGDGVALPLALLAESSTDTLALVTGVPHGTGFTHSSQASILPDGTLMLINNSPSNGIDLYDSHSYSFTTHVSLAPNAPVNLGCDNTGTFYVQVATGGNYHVRKIAADGTLSGTVYDLGSATLIRGIGANKAGTVLYYYQSDIIKRWDLVNNVALSNLVSPGVHMSAGTDFLVLQDDSIVYGNTATGIVRYDGTSGTLLNTYTPPNSQPYHLSDRLASGVDATSFLLYQVDGSATNHTVFIKVSDGTILENIARAVVSGGAQTGTATATPYLWGPDATCPAWVTRVPFTPPPPVPFIGTRQTLPIRRERTVPIPVLPGNARQKISRLELQFQPGTGLPADPTTSPNFFVRMSWDNGKTWSNERLMNAGREGAYITRAFVNLLGSGRFPVVQIVTSDTFLPVLTNAFITGAEGAH